MQLNNVTIQSSEANKFYFSNSKKQWNNSIAIVFFLISFAFEELGWFCLFYGVQIIEFVSFARLDCYVV